MSNDTKEIPEKQVVVIGGGPAGLTAAYELSSKHNVKPVVIEKADKVGGISRTENYKGYFFDMGGHRFFTKSKAVNDFWQEVMAKDFLRRPRLSRIYYNGKFFNYPIKPFNALKGLGFIESVFIVLSYIRWQIFPYKQEETFEQWVTNRFGQRLFLTFFKTYTEKVWGISTSELKAEWAAQRIKDLSLKTAIISMFVKPGNKITTLIEEFDYPRRGPGMMWTTVKEQVEDQGGTVHMNSEVVKIHRNGKSIKSIEMACNGHRQVIEGTDFVSSMPVTEFIKRLDPPPPEPIINAAKQLKYRDFLTVCLIVNKEDLFPDNWIYIHSPEVQVGRIQNFKNWSPEMVPDLSKSSLGLEYFCNEGDDLWTMPDDELVELGKRELDRIGLASYDDVEDGCVFRVPKSYPVYDSEYKEHLETLKEYLAGLENFQTIGRNGLHRYNNQDHAMLTGMLAVRNMMFGEENNLWIVNAEQKYHEEVYRDDAEAEIQEVTDIVKEKIVEVFTKLDAPAFGTAVGIATGLLLFLATIILVVRGGAVVGPHLSLLGNYLPGYSVTAMGSLLGLFYGFLLGFCFGWVFAFLRNMSMFLHMALIQRRAELNTLARVFDYI
jgi:protoporphyrinogen oxidase